MLTLEYHGYVSHTCYTETSVSDTKRGTFKLQESECDKCSDCL